MSGPLPENRLALLEAALALPALAWMAVGAVLLVATLFGYRALAAPADLTMAEVAVVRDEAELLRQIRHGAAPNVQTTIRRGMLSDQDYFMTPLEAALAGRHVETFQLLVENGATLTSRNFSRLTCLARLSEATDIVAFLERHSPPDAGAVECTGVRLPW